MNDSTVRIHAGLIKENVIKIAAITSEIKRSFDILYPELGTADPQHDRDFERFMLSATRALNALTSDSVVDLARSAQHMEGFISSATHTEKRDRITSYMPSLISGYTRKEILRRSQGRATPPAEPSAPGGRASREPRRPALASESYYEPVNIITDAHKKVTV